MHFPKHISRAGAAIVLSLGAFTAGCSGGGDNGIMPNQTAGVAGAKSSERVSTALPVTLEASSISAKVGDRVAIAVRANGAALPEKLQAIAGRLAFDASKLSYVGQTNGTEYLLNVNDAHAALGELKFMSLQPRGLEARTATFVFEVKAAGYVDGLKFVYEGGATHKFEVATANVAPGVSAVSDLAVGAAARQSLAEWVARTAPSDRFKVSALPGQCVAGLKYGDVTLNGLLQSSDVAYTSNVAVQFAGSPLLDSVQTGLIRDAVIAGNVRPINGGSGSTNPPGDGFISVLDVNAISNFVVGIAGTAVVGDAIPGRVTCDVTGKPRVVITTDITANRTFTKDTIYQIADGTVPNTDVGGVISVRGGATLTIQPGTQIEGWPGSRGTAGPGGTIPYTQQGVLNIARDGRIIADGTKLEPIVFTCVVPTILGPKGEAAGQRWSGCWGGLYIDGNATINNDNATASATGSPAVADGANPVGRSAGGCRQDLDELNGALGTYGGCNDADSSGVIRYVRVEYGGGRVSSVKERNGITFNGVGRGTVVDYVQSFASLDDASEYFGGTVNVKHMYLVGAEDDNIDWVNGYRGKGQFIIVQADSVNGDRCFEMDSNGVDGGNPNQQPYSNPQFWNVTCVGKRDPIRYSSFANIAAQGTPAGNCLNQLSGNAQTPTNNSNCVNQAFLFRQNTGGEIRNVIAYRYAVGLDIDIAAAPQADQSAICTWMANGNAGLGDAPGTNGNTTNPRFFFGSAAIFTGPVPATLASGNLTSQTGDPDGSDPNTAGQTAAPFTCANLTHSGTDLEVQYINDAQHNIVTKLSTDASPFIGDPFNQFAPDFRPTASGATTATPTATPTDAFFDASGGAYIGAVAPVGGAGIPWYAGWTRGFTNLNQK